jgi:hypothetical protein
MPSLIKRGRKSGDVQVDRERLDAPGVPETRVMEQPDDEPMEAEAHAASAPQEDLAPEQRPMLQRQPPPGPTDTPTYQMPGAIDFDPPISYEPAPKPPPSIRSTGSLLNRVLGDPGEVTPEERDRIAAQEFEQAIAPVMDLMRAAVPEASTPEDAERILAQNQGEITPDPQGGGYIHGDSFDRDARVYYRLLRRDYEKQPRPSEKRKTSHHLHGIYGKLTGTKGW